MDRVLFERWIRETDKKFLSKGRKVAFMIDNCPDYPQIENLKSISQ